MTQAPERKLAVLLHADIVGSTSLIQNNETIAHGRIQDAFHRLSATISNYEGIAHEIRGDALVAEFSKASDAVSAALEFQAANQEHNDGLADEIRPSLRIGIAMGEVIIADNTVTGEGVVLAQRIEQLAESGSVCIQGAAYETMPKRLPFEFENLGEQQVKGFAEPVKVYSASPRSASAIREPLPLSQQKTPGLLEKPSIAVLPFTNMSGDVEQDYFADGITEDIITELSRFGSLLVIARNSTFIFKGQAVDLADIAKKLGVHYVVEGSVRKSGNRVRITAQLIDIKSGNHLWADRYDRNLEDVFAIQDEVVSIIAGKIPGTLERLGVDFARRTPPENATAFDLTLRGRWSLHHSNEGTQSAIDYLEQAVSADKNYASAHAHLSYAYAYAMFTLGAKPDHAIPRSLSHATRSVTLDSHDPEVNAVAAIGFLLCGDYDHADVHSERAITTNPNDQMVLYSRGLTLTYLGRATEALPYFEQMALVDPYAPDDVRADGFCDCLFILDQYEEMLKFYRHWVNLPPHLYLIKAVALAKLGRIDEARSAIDEYDALDVEKADIKTFVSCHMRMLARLDDREKWLDGYRKAGIPV